MPSLLRSTKERSCVIGWPWLRVLKKGVVHQRQWVYVTWCKFRCKFMHFQMGSLCKEKIREKNMENIFVVYQLDLPLQFRDAPIWELWANIQNFFFLNLYIWQCWYINIYEMQKLGLQLPGLAPQRDGTFISMWLQMLYNG